MPAAPVSNSAELERVLALPRRAPRTPEQWRELARAWSYALLNDAGRAELARIEALPEPARSEAFRKHAKNHCPLLLNEIQTQVLLERSETGGVYVAATVGAGKTLLTWLLVVIGNADRPLVLVPASSEQETHTKFRAISKYWRAPRVIPHVETLDWLSREPLGLCTCRGCSGQDLPPGVAPGGLRPTQVVVDEADLLRAAKSGRTLRFVRYVTTHLAECSADFLTATPMRKRLQDFAHLMILALRRRAPLPINAADLRAWGSALDFAAGEPVPFGALIQFVPEHERDAVAALPYMKALEKVVEAFSKRLLETPGVIVSTKQSCDQPLTLRFFSAPFDLTLAKAFEDFRTTQCTPDGWDVDDPLSAFQYGTELSCGFYSMWDPRPPDEWLEDRREASVFVRETIQKSQRSGRRHLDTIGEVYKAYPNEPCLVQWRETKPTFEPNVVAVPITASVLCAAAEHVRREGPLLVWVQHTYVGEILSKLLGAPYYASKGLDASGRYIMDHDPATMGPAIASIHSNSRERNLQYNWHRALVVGPPQAATMWEQGIFGRMHRQGQSRPVVVDVLLASAENLRAVQEARHEAEGAARVWMLRQKILDANFEWSAFDATLLDLDRNHPARPQWTLPQ